MRQISEICRASKAPEDPRVALLGFPWGIACGSTGSQGEAQEGQKQLETHIKSYFLNRPTPASHEQQHRTFSSIEPCVHSRLMPGTMGSNVEKARIGGWWVGLDRLSLGHRARLAWDPQCTLRPYNSMGPWRRESSILSCRNVYLNPPPTFFFFSFLPTDLLIPAFGFTPNHLSTFAEVRWLASFWNLCLCLLCIAWPRVPLLVGMQKTWSWHDLKATGIQPSKKVSPTQHSHPTGPGTKST